MGVVRKHNEGRAVRALLSEVCTHVLMHVGHVCVEARVHPQVFLWCRPPGFFEPGSLPDLEFSRQAMLAGHRAQVSARLCPAPAL